MSNVFKKAKQLRKSNPGKSWQQLVQMASKKGTAKKKAAKKSAPRKKATKRKKVGAYKVIEKHETKSTPVKKVVRNVRSKKGTFKGTVTVGAVKKFYEQKLQGAMWKHEKATTVGATKAAAKEKTKYRALLKKL
jgi:NADH:ubiquinone oxidoreductase subunit D